VLETVEDERMNGRSPSGRATHERSQSALSPPSVGIPNAYDLADLLRAIAVDCENTDGWQGASADLRASADLLEQFAVTVRHAYAEKMPNTWFVSGASTVTDANGLPARIHVCPAYGCDWSVIYERQAQVGEAQRAATTGAVEDEHAVPEGDAPQ